MSADIAKAGQQRLGFAWWLFWGWFSLIVGTLVSLAQLNSFGGFAVVLGAVNIGLSVMIIRISKTAFVLGTVLSVNPILWIINGIYIKNRWHDPRVLENRGMHEGPNAPTQGGQMSAQHAWVVDTESAPGKTIVQDPWPTQSVQKALVEPEALPTSDEDLWEKAMQEAESQDRRQGLWAKCFGEAHGVEAAAKAAYMAARVLEMKAEIVAAQQGQEARRLDHKKEDRQALERLLKGACPNCYAIISIAATECPRCKVHFGPNSTWSVKPLA